MNKKYMEETNMHVFCVNCNNFNADAYFNKKEENKHKLCKYVKECNMDIPNYSLSYNQRPRYED